MRFLQNYKWQMGLAGVSMFQIDCSQNLLLSRLYRVNLTNFEKVSEESLENETESLMYS